MDGEEGPAVDDYNRLLADHLLLRRVHDMYGTHEPPQPMSPSRRPPAPQGLNRADGEWALRCVLMELGKHDAARSIRASHTHPAGTAVPPSRARSAASVRSRVPLAVSDLNERLYYRNVPDSAKPSHARDTRVCLAAPLSPTPASQSLRAFKTVQHKHALHATLASERPSATPSFLDTSLQPSAARSCMLSATHQPQSAFEASAKSAQAQAELNSTWPVAGGRGRPTTGSSGASSRSRALMMPRHTWDAVGDVSLNRATRGRGTPSSRGGVRGSGTRHGEEDMDFLRELQAQFNISTQSGRGRGAQRFEAIDTLGDDDGGQFDDITSSCAGGTEVTTGESSGPAIQHPTGLDQLVAACREREGGAASGGTTGDSLALVARCGRQDLVTPTASAIGRGHPQQQQQRPPGKPRAQQRKTPAKQRTRSGKGARQARGGGASAAAARRDGGRGIRIVMTPASGVADPASVAGSGDLSGSWTQKRPHAPPPPPRVEQACSSPHRWPDVLIQSHSRMGGEVRHEAHEAGLPARGLEGTHMSGLADGSLEASSPPPVSAVAHPESASPPRGSTGAKIVFRTVKDLIMAMLMEKSARKIQCHMRRVIARKIWLARWEKHVSHGVCSLMHAKGLVRAAPGLMLLFRTQHRTAVENSAVAMKECGMLLRRVARGLAVRRAVYAQWFEAKYGDLLRAQMFQRVGRGLLARSAAARRRCDAMARRLQRVWRGHTGRRVIDRRRHLSPTFASPAFTSLKFVAGDPQTITTTLSFLLPAFHRNVRRLQRFTTAYLARKRVAHRYLQLARLRNMALWKGFWEPRKLQIYYRRRLATEAGVPPVASMRYGLGALLHAAPRRCGQSIYWLALQVKDLLAPAHVLKRVGQGCVARQRLWRAHAAISTLQRVGRGERARRCTARLYRAMACLRGALERFWCRLLVRRQVAARCITRWWRRRCKALRAAQREAEAQVQRWIDEQPTPRADGVPPALPAVKSSLVLNTGRSAGGSSKRGKGVSFSESSTPASRRVVAGGAVGGPDCLASAGLAGLALVLAAEVCPSTSLVVAGADGGAAWRGRRGLRMAAGGGRPALSFVAACLASSQAVKARAPSTRGRALKVNLLPLEECPHLAQIVRLGMLVQAERKQHRSVTSASTTSLDFLPAVPWTSSAEPTPADERLVPPVQRGAAAQSTPAPKSALTTLVNDAPRAGSKIALVERVANSGGASQPCADASTYSLLGDDVDADANKGGGSPTTTSAVAIMNTHAPRTGSKLALVESLVVGSTHGHPDTRTDDGEETAQAQEAVEPGLTTMRKHAPRVGSKIRLVEKIAAESETLEHTSDPALTVLCAHAPRVGSKIRLVGELAGGSPAVGEEASMPASSQDGHEAAVSTDACDAEAEGSGLAVLRKHSPRAGSKIRLVEALAAEDASAEAVDATRDGSDAPAVADLGDGVEPSGDACISDGSAVASDTARGASGLAVLRKHSPRAGSKIRLVEALAAEEGGDVAPSDGASARSSASSAGDAGGGAPHESGPRERSPRVDSKARPVAPLVNDAGTDEAPDSQHTFADPPTTDVGSDDTVSDLTVEPTADTITSAAATPPDGGLTVLCASAPRAGSKIRLVEGLVNDSRDEAVGDKRDGALDDTVSSTAGPDASGHAEPPAGGVAEGSVLQESGLAVLCSSAPRAGSKICLVGRLVDSPDAQQDVVDAPAYKSDASSDDAMAANNAGADIEGPALTVLCAHAPRVGSKIRLVGELAGGSPAVGEEVSMPASSQDEEDAAANAGAGLAVLRKHSPRAGSKIRLVERLARGAGEAPVGAAEVAGGTAADDGRDAGHEASGLAVLRKHSPRAGSKIRLVEALAADGSGEDGGDPKPGAQACPGLAVLRSCSPAACSRLQLLEGLAGPDVAHAGTPRAAPTRIQTTAAVRVQAWWRGVHCRVRVLAVLQAETHALMTEYLRRVGVDGASADGRTT